MTTNEIYTALKNTDDTKLQDLYQILSSNDSTVIINYLKANNNQNDPLTVFSHAIIHDEVSSSRSNYYLDYSIKSTYLIFYTKNINGLKSDDILNNLPKEFWKYLPTKQKNRVQKEDQIKTRQAKIQTLNLDEFSFLAYKASLSKSKSLSSAQALAQLKSITFKKGKTPEEENIKDRYYTLIWEHVPKKSLALCDYIIRNSSRTYREFSLFQYLGGYNCFIQDILNQPKFNNAAYINIAFYQSIAREYNIPVEREFYTDRYSDHHSWLVGVDKPSPLTFQQLEMTISQITVLKFIIDNLQGNSTCPYFIKAYEQLVNEITKPIYREDMDKLLSKSIKAHNSAITSYQVLANLIKRRN